MEAVEAGQEQEGGEAAASASSGDSWARRRPAVPRPWGVGGLQAPVAVRVDSEGLSLKAEGWATSRGYTYLPRPATARLAFSPAASK